MLPIELVTHLSQYLAIEDLVSLGLTCHQWEDAIPDSVYQLVMMRHCPSFTPEATSRGSWKACARTHVSRLKDQNWNMKTDSPACFTFFPQVIAVTKNIPVPSNFQSLMDGFKSHGSHGYEDVEYMTGNGVRVMDTVIYLGSDKIGKRIGIEHKDPSPLRAGNGTQLGRKGLLKGDLSETRISTSEAAIGYSSFGEFAEGVLITQSVVKLNTPGEEPDESMILGDTGFRYGVKMSPFASGDKVSVAMFFPSPYSCSIFFTNVYNNNDSRESQKVILKNEATGVTERIFWCDGLVIRVVRDLLGLSILADFYDCEYGIAQVCTQIRAGQISAVQISQDQRWAILYDEYGLAGSIMDLKTKQVYNIVPSERRAITIVGTVDGRLSVATFDGDFAANNIPFSQRDKAKNKDFSNLSKNEGGPSFHMCLLHQLKHYQIARLCKKPCPSHNYSEYLESMPWIPKTPEVRNSVSLTLQHLEIKVLGVLIWLTEDVGKCFHLIKDRKWLYWPLLTLGIASLSIILHGHF